MTPVLAIISAAQDRFVARFQVPGAIGHAKNPDARIGTDRDIPECSVRPNETHRARNRHVDSRIRGKRIGKLGRNGFAARRLAGLFRLREGRAIDEEGIGQERLRRGSSHVEDESQGSDGCRAVQERTRNDQAGHLREPGRVTMKMAEFGLWAAFAGGLPDNACDAAAEALNATTWGG